MNNPDESKSNNTVGRYLYSGGKKIMIGVVTIRFRTEAHIERERDLLDKNEGNLYVRDKSFNGGEKRKLLPLLMADETKCLFT